MPSPSLALGLGMVGALLTAHLQTALASHPDDALDWPVEGERIPVLRAGFKPVEGR